MNRWDDPGEESVTTRDLYEVLGVARDATDSQIKRAYHKLAMVHHPDKRAQNPSGEEPNTLNPKPQTLDKRETSPLQTPWSSAGSPLATLDPRPQTLNPKS